MIASATNREEKTNLKDRLITKEEINEITKKAPIREKAFFTMMRQSGLPPHTIKQLKIGDVEKILEEYTPVPCRITLTHEKIPTFIGHETVNYLKQYLLEKANLQQGSLLFTIRNKPNKEINTKDVSRTFRRAAEKLKSPNKSACETKKGKAGELRLYSLIKFYKENAKRYITELNKVTTPQDIAFYRKLYAREAMPNLEIELPTPIQIHQLRDRLAYVERTVQETVTPIKRLYFEVAGLIPDDKDMLLEELKPYVPEKNEEDREQRLQNVLHKLGLKIKEEENKEKTKKTTRVYRDVPTPPMAHNRYAKPRNQKRHRKLPRASKGQPTATDKQ